MNTYTPNKTHISVGTADIDQDLIYIHFTGGPLHGFTWEVEFNPPQILRMGISRMRPGRRPSNKPHALYIRKPGTTIYEYKRMVVPGENHRKTTD